MYTASIAPTIPIPPHYLPCHPSAVSRTIFVSISHLQTIPARHSSAPISMIYIYIPITP